MGIYALHLRWKAPISVDGLQKVNNYFNDMKWRSIWVDGFVCKYWIRPRFGSRLGAQISSLRGKITVVVLLLLCGTFIPAVRAGVDYVVLIDQSAAARTTDEEGLRFSAAALVVALARPGEDHVACIEFSDTANIVFPGNHRDGLGDMKVANKKAALDIIDDASERTKESGRQETVAALDRAADVFGLRAKEQSRRIALLFAAGKSETDTDGERQRQLRDAITRLTQAPCELYIYRMGTSLSTTKPGLWPGVPAANIRRIARPADLIGLYDFLAETESLLQLGRVAGSQFTLPHNIEHLWITDFGAQKNLQLGKVESPTGDISPGTDVFWSNPTGLLEKKHRHLFCDVLYQGQPAPGQWTLQPVKDRAPAERVLVRLPLDISASIDGPNLPEKPHEFSVRVRPRAPENTVEFVRLTGASLPGGPLMDVQAEVQAGPGFAPTVIELEPRSVPGGDGLAYSTNWTPSEPGSYQVVFKVAIRDTAGGPAAYFYSAKRAVQISKFRRKILLDEVVNEEPLAGGELAYGAGTPIPLPSVSIRGNRSDDEPGETEPVLVYTINRSDSGEEVFHSDLVRKPEGGWGYREARALILGPGSYRSTVCCKDPTLPIAPATRTFLVNERIELDKARMESGGIPKLGGAGHSAVKVPVRMWLLPQSTLKADFEPVSPIAGRCGAKESWFARPKVENPGSISRVAPADGDAAMILISLADAAQSSDSILPGTYLVRWRLSSSAGKKPAEISIPIELQVDQPKGFVIQSSFDHPPASGEVYSVHLNERPRDNNLARTRQEYVWLVDQNRGAGALITEDQASSAPVRVAKLRWTLEPAEELTDESADYWTWIGTAEPRVAKLTARITLKSDGCEYTFSVTKQFAPP